MAKITALFTGFVLVGVALVTTGETPAPAAAKAKVFFKTDPAGAAIVVAGQKLGVTPAMLELAAGKYQVTFQLSGFEDKSVAVEVQPDIVNRVEATLSGSGVKIEVKSLPTGALVFIDDKVQNDAEGNPLVTPCTLTLRQVHAGMLGVAKAGYRDGIKKDVLFKDGGKYDFTLERGASELLGGGQECTITPEEEVKQYDSFTPKPCQQPHKIKPKKFSGTLTLLVNSLNGTQPSGLEFKQGTPLKIVRTGGRWHHHGYDVSADPKQVTGGLVGFRIGQVEVRFQDKYEGVAPDNGELLFFATNTSITSWGAVELTITAGDCQQVAEPASINLAARTVYQPKGAPMASHTVTLDLNKVWTATRVEAVKGSPVRFTLKVLNEQGQPATTALIRRVSEEIGLVLRVGDDPRDPLTLLKFNAPLEMPASGMIYLGPKAEDWPKMPVVVLVTMEGSLRLLPGK